MKSRFIRSAATAVRISLISGCGALGWLALSAGAAAADDGGDQGLMGSATPVVQSVTTPVQSLIQNVAAPLKPATDSVAPSSGTTGLISSLPHLVGNLSVSDTVAPVTTLVDSALSQVPVVNDVLPSGTAKAITHPVLQAVDSVVAPVLPPVQQVLTPVVEVLDQPASPVVGIVDPAPDPAQQPATPGTLQPSPVDVQKTAAMAESALPGPGSVTSSDPGPGSLPVTDGPSVKTEAPSPQPHGVHYQSGFYQIGQHTAQAAPQLAFPDPQPAGEPLGLPAASGAASSGSSTTGSTSAADTTLIFTFSPSSALSPQSGYSAALPQGPAFEPGSTPD